MKKVLKNQKEIDQVLQEKLVRLVEKETILALAKNKVKTIQPNEQFLIFFLKLDQYFFTHNMLGLKPYMEDDHICRNYGVNKKGKVIVDVTRTPAIKIKDDDICNVTFIPRNDGIELNILEVFNKGRGLGTQLMNVFNTISEETGIKIILIPGDPNHNNTGDDEKRRNFYHKNGFKRTNNSIFWSNEDVLKAA